MKAGNPRIQDSDITASSSWDLTYAPDHGRLNSMKINPCWGPKNCKKNNTVQQLLNYKKIQ